MQCPKCNAAAMLSGPTEDGERAVSFSVFALVLFGAGAAMHLVGVKVWPWWLYCIAGFVLFQALLKWVWSAHRYCPKCQYSMNVWPWSKEQGESRKAEVGNEPRPAAPSLAAVRKRFTGETVERALEQFEDECSEENVDTLVIEERVERSDGVLVRYEVRWKHSVFDDYAYASYVSWARLQPADPAAGDPAEARYYVAEATAEHHNL